MPLVFISDRKATRQSRPASERVPPLILRRVTWQRMSFSEPKVVQRDVGPVEHHQELRLVGMQPFQRPIEGGVAGALIEDARHKRALRRALAGAVGARW